MLQLHPFAGHLDVVTCLYSLTTWKACINGGSSSVHKAMEGEHFKVIEWMINDACEVWDSFRTSFIIVIQMDSIKILISSTCFRNMTV